MKGTNLGGRRHYLSEKVSPHPATGSRGGANRKNARVASAPAGSVQPIEGAIAKPDCTIALSDADLVALASGKLSAMSAYMSGKLKVQGKTSLAQKLALLLSDGKPKSKL